MKIWLTVRGYSEARTLDGMKADLENFQQNGGRLSEAKAFNNVLDTALFDIPLAQVKLFSVFVH